MKKFLKGIYYTVKKPKLKAGYSVSFGFIFHTERIYNNEVFKSLVDFCTTFRDLTGKRVLCVVMSPLNIMVAAEMKKAGVPLEEFVSRLQILSEVADVGFHGHFWRAESALNVEENQVRQHNFKESDVSFIQAQFATDYHYLKQFNFTNPVYSAGWWFINPSLIGVLLNEKLIGDFSFSSLDWVSNDWAKEFLRKRNIRFGESFQVVRSNQTLTCVQTLMGCPNTPYVEDFIRIINSYLDENMNPTGMIATHDYNLIEGKNFTYAVNLIDYLRQLNVCTFCSANELLTKSNGVMKKIELD